jgi:hypothetical protein
MVATRLTPLLTWKSPDEDYETTTYLCDVENKTININNPEGWVAWVTWQDLFNGCFGTYMQKLYNKYYNNE